MRNSFLSSQFSELVEKNVKLIFGLEIGETAVTEALERTISNHCTEMVHVSDKGLQVRNIIVQWFASSNILIALIDLKYSFDYVNLVAAIL